MRILLRLIVYLTLTQILNKYPLILVVNILPYKRIEYITLKPILDSEVFINGNYRVIKNIFLK